MVIDSIDQGVYALATTRQREIIDAVRAYGGVNKAAYALGINQSNVTRGMQAALATAAKAGYDPLEFDNPRVLIFDIETAPIKGFIWSMWQHGVPLCMIKDDWFVLSWAAMWLDDEDTEEAVMYQDIRDTIADEDDKDLLHDIWHLLDEADVVITQNGIKFDSRKLNSRFIINGYQKPSSYKHIDTLRIAKKQFGFTSNKLEYMTDKLCVKWKKLKHAQFAGFELWDECLKGNPLAWKEMEKYNRHDVLSLRELYFIIRPWDNMHPNFNWYSDSLVPVCQCGCTTFIKDGFAYTATSKFQRYRCTDCGHETRDKVNLFSKEKRQSLRNNVAGF